MINCEAFELNSLLEGIVEVIRLKLEQFITEGWTEVGDKKVEGHVIERRSGTMGDKSVSSSSAVGRSNGHEGVDAGEGVRPNCGREGKSVARDKGFKIINSFDNTWIEGCDGLILSLFEVSKIDSGSAGGADSAPGFKEGSAKLIPVVTINTGAAKRIIPQEGSATEGVVDECAGLDGRPCGGRASS